jgi:hypothetical protein
MVNFKKFVAILCSATMVAAAPITALASDPSTTAATGNIIAFSAETVTVPTSIKVSFNPQEWEFAVDSSTKVEDQIVSLNYGISSMATMDKKVSIEFEASGTAIDGKEPVVFVDSADKATAKSDTNTDGAEVGEFKMYLAVAGGDAVVTKSRGSSAVTFGVTNGAHNITADLLADVDMTAEDGGAQAFAAGGDGLASTSIAFTLGAAEYELKASTNPGFTTTQGDFAAMVQAKELGDIVGFTFIGAMNKNADWTKANLTAIAIEPTYEIEDATGEEEAVTGGAYNQIEADSAVAGVAEVLTYNKIVYLALYGPSKATFSKAATSLIVNTKDVTAKATMINGVLAVKATDLAAAGVDTSGTLAATYVVDGVTYTATLTQ